MGFQAMRCILWSLLARMTLLSFRWRSTMDPILRRLKISTTGLPDRKEKCGVVKLCCFCRHRLAGEGARQ